MKSNPRSWLTRVIRIQSHLAGAAILLAGSLATAGPLPLVPHSAVWRYDDTGTNLGAAWLTPRFSDTAWPGGPGQLGFGDGDEATQLASGRVTYYFRHRFVLTHAAALTNLSAAAIFSR